MSNDIYCSLLNILDDIGLEVSMFYIYALIDPRTHKPFYIGKGRGRRCFDHLFRKEHSNKYKQHVIQQIRNDNLEPLVTILIDRIHDEEQAYSFEESVISQFGLRIKNTGILTNLTEGGKGTKRPHRTIEHRKKLGWSKGIHLPESQKQAISRSLSGRKTDKSIVEKYTKSRIANGNTGRSEECRKKISEALTGKIQSKETKLKRSISLKTRGAPGKKYQIVEDPSGSQYTVTSLKTFCKEHNIYLNSILNTYKHDLPNKRNPGWKIVLTGLLADLKT
jgi:hypothetical protein